MHKIHSGTACVLAILLILTLLSGCVPAGVVESLATLSPVPVPTENPSAVPTVIITPTPSPEQDTAPAATPEPTPVPAFAVKSVLSAGKRLPIVENCTYEEEINAALAAVFTPWAEQILQAKGSGYPVELQYSSYIKEFDHERFCILYPRLESADGVYRLPTLTFSPDEAELPAYPLPSHEGFSDPVYVQALIRLSSAGVNVDPDRDPAVLLTPENFFWEIEDLYTLYTGRDLDASGSELGDTSLARAAVLGLISAEQARTFANESAGKTGFTMEAQFLSSVLASFTSRVLRDRSGVYSEEAEAGQSFDVAVSALETWALASGIRDSKAWQDTMALLPGKSGSDHAALTRLTLAAQYVSLYEAAFGTVPESQWTTLLDTEEPSARKAHSAYLMTSFPGSRYFCPAYPVAVHDMYDWSAQFVSGFSGRFLKLHPKVRTEPMTVRNLYAALGCWLTRIDLSEAQEFSTAEVNNSRDHDWYVSQYDGSSTAVSNCMPAMTAMVLRWLDPTDPATPASVRALSASTAVAWKMRQVEEVLQKENVSYYIRRLDLDQWVRDLDAGCLVLIQTNEGSLSGDGHCLVLYGYRRYGESTTFLVMDPGYSTKTDLFGEPLGKGLELDARYVWLIASRFSSTNLSVRR